MASSIAYVASSHRHFVFLFYQPRKNLMQRQRKEARGSVAGANGNLLAQFAISLAQLIRSLPYNREFQDSITDVPALSGSQR